MLNVSCDLFRILFNFGELKGNDVRDKFSEFLLIVLEQEVHRGKGDTLTMQPEADRFNLIGNNRGKEHRAFRNLVFQRDALVCEGVHSGSEGLSPDFEVNFGFRPINLCVLSIQIFVHRINEFFCLGMYDTLIFKFKLLVNKQTKLESIRLFVLFTLVEITELIRIRAFDI